MCVVVLLYSWRAAYLRVSITNPGSAGLQGMTDTVRKLEHQPKSDGQLLCMMANFYTALPLTVIAAEVQKFSPKEKEVLSTVIDKLQKHKDSTGVPASRKWSVSRAVKSCGCHRDNWFVPAVVDGYQADERRQDNMPSVV